MFETARKVIRAPEFALAVRKHVWQNVHNKCASDRRSLFQSSPVWGGVVSAHFARVQCSLVAKAGEQREAPGGSRRQREVCCLLRTVQYGQRVVVEARQAGGGRRIARRQARVHQTVAMTIAGVQAKIRRCNGARLVWLEAVSRAVQALSPSTHACHGILFRTSLHGYCTVLARYQAHTKGLSVISAAAPVTSLQFSLTRIA